MSSENEKQYTEFTEAMKKTHTILAPDIFPTHMELLEKVFALNGFRVEVLHDEDRSVIDTGLKYIHNDMCYPAICAVGQQLHALTSGKYDTHKVALVQFQTGGGCRASNYIMLLRKALENMGLGYVPVISVNFAGLEKHGGFKITPRMALQAFYALAYGDLILLLKNQCEPYETNSGDTRKIVLRWVNKIGAQLERSRGMSDRELRANFIDMAADFHIIPREDRKLTKVGIVGEIYVKYSSFGNNGLEKFLLSQGCEFMVPGVLGFFQAYIKNIELDYDNYGGSRLKLEISRLLLKKLALWEKYMDEAVSRCPGFVAPLPFDRVVELAKPIIDLGVKMGEGWLLPGEVAELIELGYSNVICTQPFGCLPNHIVGKGTIRRIRELYPKANIFPVDYDAGASKVNQENRIKLMLAIANDEEQQA